MRVHIDLFMLEIEFTLLDAVDECRPLVVGERERRLRRILGVADTDLVGGDGDGDAEEQPVGLWAAAGGLEVFVTE